MQTPNNWDEDNGDEDDDYRKFSKAKIKKLLKDI